MEMETTKLRNKIRKKKNTYHHGSLHEAVIAATLELVAKRGPSGFTLVQAAKMAGVVPSALYRHFANREALLAAIAREGFEQLVICLQSALESGGGPLNSRTAVSAQMS
jgi:AcrR family transcriptional regulator